MVRTREGCYSVAGAARLLGVSRQRVYQLIKRGRIATEPYTGPWHPRPPVWIPEKALREYMENRAAWWAAKKDN